MKYVQTNIPLSRLYYVLLLTTTLAITVTKDKMTVIMITQNIINHCAVFWCLIKFFKLMDGTIR